MKYKIDGTWYNKKQWKELISSELDSILEYQELDTHAEGEDGKQYQLWVDFKMGVEEY